MNNIARQIYKPLQRDRYDTSRPYFSPCLEWKRGTKRYFNIKETLGEKKFKLAKLKFIKHANAWLMGVQNQRQLEGKEKIHGRNSSRN